MPANHDIEVSARVVRPDYAVTLTTTRPFSTGLLPGQDGSR